MSGFGDNLELNVKVFDLVPRQHDKLCFASKKLYEKKKKLVREQVFVAFITQIRTIICLLLGTY